jgi:hypothetical protein
MNPCAVIPQCVYRRVLIGGGGALEVWEPVRPGLVLYTGKYNCFGLDRGHYMLVYRFGRVCVGFA